MNYINRREICNRTNEKPFNARHTEKTMIKHSKKWLATVDLLTSPFSGVLTPLLISSGPLPTISFF
jgi:hypothetical protein